MKPRIQCVVTQWKSGFRASGSGPIFMINLSGALGQHERRIHAVWPDTGGAGGTEARSRVRAAARQAGRRAKQRGDLSAVSGVIAPETADKAAGPERGTHNISLAGQEKETQTS